MKRLIIGGIIAIVIAGGIGAGAAFLRNSSSSINNNSKSVSSTQAINGKIDANTSNTQSADSNNIQSVNNKSNGNSNIQNSDNNQGDLSNSSQINNTNSQTQNLGNTKTTPSIKNQNTFKMQLGNGDFNSLRGSNFIYITVSNGAKLMLTISSTVDNKQLQGTEYYLNRLNEKFNVKISSIGGNKYLIYEFYNGQHTGTFEMNGANGNVEGTYTHAGSNQTIGANFYFEATGMGPGSMSQYPFYDGQVNGTPITWVNTNIGSYIELYKGDSNPFTISTSFTHTGNYELEFLEQYNDKITGEYKFEPNPSSNKYVGVYVKKSNGQSYDVNLTGSMTPDI